MSPLSELKAILKANLPWHQQRIDTLGRLIIAPIKVRSVNLTEIACAFGGKAHRTSAYRRLQRFFSSYPLSLDEVAHFIYQLFFSRCPRIPQYGSYELEMGACQYQYFNVVSGLQRRGHSVIVESIG